MKTFIIFHGTMGSPDINWFPWIKDILEQQNHQVLTPQLPTPENQNKDNWLNIYKDLLQKSTGDITLIGHSCGATFVLHALEQENTPKIEQAILVSPVIDYIDYEEFNKLNHSFVKHEFIWDNIQKSTAKITVFHGDNDPYVPLSHPNLICKNLSIEPIIIKNGGHLNSEFGYLEFKELLNYLI